MARPPKTKTADWRRFLTKEEAATVDRLDSYIETLDKERAELSASRRKFVARGMNRWQHWKRAQRAQGKRR